MNPYEDIIDLPHHRSATHPRMAREDRAAQFAPFAALNGYEAAIRETGRLTDTAAELMESSAVAIDEALRAVRQRLRDQPEVTVTYFRPDERKAGGAYLTVTGRVRKLMEYERILLLHDGREIHFDQIYELALITENKKQQTHEQ